MNRAKIAAGAAALAMLAPVGMVVSAPAAHAKSPVGATATASATAYPNTPWGRFCAKHPYLRPLC